MFNRPTWILIPLLLVSLIMAACNITGDDEEEPTNTPETDIGLEQTASPEAVETEGVTESPAAAETTTPAGTGTMAGSPEPGATEMGTASPAAAGTGTVAGSPAATGAATAAPGGGTPEADLIGQGGQIFANVCAACHQPDGQGVEGAYPALAGNPFVTADNPEPIIDVVLTGRGGMPRFGGTYSNEQIAGIVSYIRQAWENDATPVDPEQVQQVRQSLEEAGEGESDEGTSGQEESGD